MTKIFESVIIIVLTAILTPFMAVAVAIAVVPGQTHHALKTLWRNHKYNSRGL
jgi:hypothetical protein